jgi:NAD(P)H-dependent FMN reductase
VILSTPAYGAAPSARLKNLFDRLGQLSFLTSFFGGKYVAVIATASRSAKGTAAQLKAVAAASVFQRTRISGALAVGLGGRHVRDMPRATDHARQLGARLAEDIRRHRQYPLQGLSSRIINGLITRPLMARKITQFRNNGLQAVYAELVRKGSLAPAG